MNGAPGSRRSSFRGRSEPERHVRLIDAGVQRVERLRAALEHAWIELGVESVAVILIGDHHAIEAERGGALLNPGQARYGERVRRLQAEGDAVECRQLTVAGHEVG